MNIAQTKLKSKLFNAVLEYCKEGGKSWSKAMIKAGYSETYSVKLGYRLLEKIEIKDAIALYSQEKQAKDAITLDYLKDKYLSLLDDCVVNNDRTNAKGVLDSLTRIAGGFNDKLAVSADKGQIPPECDVDDAVEQSRKRVASDVIA